MKSIGQFNYFAVVWRKGPFYEAVPRFHVSVIIFAVGMAQTVQSQLQSW